MGKLFASEADLVAAFVEAVDREYNKNRNIDQEWTLYHETGGYDLLLVENATGVQVGIEAKLTLNLKVINQVLPSRYHTEGPDYRAVLVPSDGVQLGLGAIAEQIGIHVLTIRNMAYGWRENEKPVWSIQRLPVENDKFTHRYENWHSWLPEKRVVLPAYVPDVVGGKPSPITLTDWKIRAIKLYVLLERNGFVTREDMRVLGLSPTRFTAAHYGFLKSDRSVKGYVRHAETPDLRGQHPVNYAQIEADYAVWSAELDEKRAKGS